MGEVDHPARWYPDPWTSGRLRYWDGKTWTANVCVPVSSAPEDRQPNPELAVTAREEQLTVAVDAVRRDLAKNRPGELVRARAEELRRAAPFRTLIARLFDMRTDERAFRVGGEGERLVGRRLARLGRTWQVLHSVSVGNNDADIDHVVIGPGGVFTLNTKHHPGGRAWVGRWAIMINGHKVPYLRSSRFEAKRAARLLSAACGFPVQVRPAIVIVTTRFDLKQQPDDVFVGRPRTVVRWLLSRPVVLTANEVAAIYEHARLDTTWRPAVAHSSRRDG